MKEALLEILLKAAPDTDISKVTMDTRLSEDLGLTSLDFLTLMFEMEDRFGVDFSDVDAFETFGEVCEYIEKHAKK